MHTDCLSKVSFPELIPDSSLLTIGGAYLSSHTDTYRAFLRSGCRVVVVQLLNNYNRGKDVGPKEFCVPREEFGKLCHKFFPLRKNHQGPVKLRMKSYQDLGGIIKRQYYSTKKRDDYEVMTRTNPEMYIDQVLDLIQVSGAEHVVICSAFIRVNDTAEERAAKYLFNLGLDKFNGSKIRGYNLHIHNYNRQFLHLAKAAESDNSKHVTCKDNPTDKTHYNGQVMTGWAYSLSHIVNNLK